MAKADQLENAADLAAGMDRFREERRIGTRQQRQLRDTRDALEVPRPDVGAEDEGPSPDGFEQTDDRQLSRDGIPESTYMQAGSDRIEFAKPTFRASQTLAEQLESMQSGMRDSDFYPWILNTLASWAIEDGHNQDWFADRIDFSEAVQLIRGLTLGGNVIGRS